MCAPWSTPLANHLESSAGCDPGRRNRGSIRCSTGPGVPCAIPAAPTRARPLRSRRPSSPSIPGRTPGATGRTRGPGQPTRRLVQPGCPMPAAQRRGDARRYRWWPAGRPHRDRPGPRFPKSCRCWRYPRSGFTITAWTCAGSAARRPSRPTALRVRPVTRTSGSPWSSHAGSTMPQRIWLGCARRRHVVPAVLQGGLGDERSPPSPVCETVSSVAGELTSRRKKSANHGKLHTSTCGCRALMLWVMA
jgi:hypothetical protein